jgi:hypothetical protein
MAHRMLAEILMRQERWNGALAEYKAAVLHSKRLLKDHPEAREIEVKSNNARAAAEAYAQVFEQIGAKGDVGTE